MGIQAASTSIASWVRTLTVAARQAGDKIVAMGNKATVEQAAHARARVQREIGREGERGERERGRWKGRANGEWWGREKDGRTDGKRDGEAEIREAGK